ncbi:hypothetical protein FOZ60_015189 [Perkinsus olseni]|uniref:Uncharacterized protein n=1 Tax=Perkinsus olseni TaxID=32597 RepID=A0A7J6P651_PEROL|nr:hypothetical protein FOZ60_015189 [Perkinsus olseni]
MEDHQDSAELNFDPVWQKAQCLNICEVEQLLRQPYARLVESGRSSAKTQCLEQSYKHALRFSKITDPEALTELRAALEDWEPPTAAQGGKATQFRDGSVSVIITRECERGEVSDTEHVQIQRQRP